ncbi:MAG: hypothetical protein EOO82_02900 [Oxalobacteraceae bacterium]|nr:MAG: hypothetical protein EOO82_02900 [Oxalobacteraceae bacterium]
MLDRIGDRPMPGLLIDIAKAEGCPRAGSKGEDRCMVHYDLNFALVLKGRSSAFVISQLAQLQPILWKRTLDTAFLCHHSLHAKKFN